MLKLVLSERRHLTSTHPISYLVSHSCLQIVPYGNYQVTRVKYPTDLCQRYRGEPLLISRCLTNKFLLRVRLFSCTQFPATWFGYIPRAISIMLISSTRLVDGLIRCGDTGPTSWAQTLWTTSLNVFLVNIYP